MTREIKSVKTMKVHYVTVFQKWNRPCVPGRRDFYGTLVRKTPGRGEGLTTVGHPIPRGNKFL